MDIFYFYTVYPMKWRSGLPSCAHLQAGIKLFKSIFSKSIFVGNGLLASFELDSGSGLNSCLLLLQVGSTKR